MQVSLLWTKPCPFISTSSRVFEQSWNLILYTVFAKGGVILFPGGSVCLFHRRWPSLGFSLVVATWKAFSGMSGKNSICFYMCGNENICISKVTREGRIVLDFIRVRKLNRVPDHHIYSIKETRTFANTVPPLTTQFNLNILKCEPFWFISQKLGAERAHNAFRIWN